MKGKLTGFFFLNLGQHYYGSQMKPYIWVFWYVWQLGVVSKNWKNLKEVEVMWQGVDEPLIYKSSFIRMYSLCWLVQVLFQKSCYMDNTDTAEMKENVHTYKL